MNPLVEGNAVYLTLSNPNPTSSKTKDGPKYRISFEVLQDEWQVFMDADTSGMVLECKCLVTNATGKEEKKPERDPNTVDALSGKTDKEAAELKGGPLSQRSDTLARDTDFWGYAKLKNAEEARDFIRGYCKVESRKMLDHNEAAAERFKSLLSDYTRWVSRC
jgi:hypothetical protein